MKWFRFYNEFRSDPKMKRMPIPHRYAFVVLLTLASEAKVRGVISGLDDDELAFELEMPKEDWLTLKAKFKARGLIDFSGDEIFIAHWDERQFESDSSAARVAKHRENQKKKACNVTKSGCNVSGTLLKRHVTPSDTDTESEDLLKEITLVHSEQNFVQKSADSEHFANAHETDTFLGQREPEEEAAPLDDSSQESEPVQAALFETTKSLDPEKNPPLPGTPPAKAPKAAKPPEFTDETFEQFWSIVPLKKGKEPTKAKFKRITGISLQAFLVSYEAAKTQYRATAREPDNWQYFRQPGTWINQKGWQDEAIAAFMPKQPAVATDETLRLVAEVTAWGELMVQAGRAIAFRVDELGKVSTQLSNGKWTNDQNIVKYCPVEKLQCEITQSTRSAA